MLSAIGAELRKEEEAIRLKTLLWGLRQLEKRRMCQLSSNISVFVVERRNQA